MAEFITRLPNLKLILAPGAPQMKMRFLKKVFPELHIKEIQGQTSRRVKGKEIKNTFYSAAIIRNGEPIQLFISNFFNNQNGIGLDGLKELAGLITNN